jgi:serine protease Do
MKRIIPVVFAFAALSAGILIGTFANRSVGAANPEQAAPLTIPKPAELSNTFAQLAKRLAPSVVKITTTVGQRAARPVTQDDEEQNNDDLLRRFFGPNGNTPRQFRSFHMGSGVIVDPNGYVITNHHVVDRATRIQVKLFDDPTEYEARLVGADRESDLAVIKVDVGHKVVPAAIGNSDGVQVGDWAIAIGAPLGFEASVTAGIISAKGRNLNDPTHPLPRFLQTDAAINQGNSGGPLLNIRGEVIGINAAIESTSGGFEGIGFAIPVNMVAKVYNDIISNGKVSRGAIGIKFNPQAKPELLKAYGATAGVFVEQVEPGGPAAKAGLKAGDIITTFRGQPVKNGDELLAHVLEAPVGSQSEVTLLRDGQKMDVKVEVADRSELNASNAPASRPARRNGREDAPDSESTAVRFGLSVQELTAADRKELNFSGKGILITAVEPASFAEDIGLREGDIITGVGREPAASIADLKKIQAALKPGDPVAFRVLRSTGRGEERQALFLAGTVPNR